MLIEIKGVQFINKGAALMLNAILAKVNELWPDSEVCLVPDANSSYLNRARIGAFQKFNLRKNIVDLNGVFYFLPKALRQYFKNKWGIVTEADVDIILDASGFNYGDQWSTILLKQAGSEAVRFKSKNKHYIFMPQALGPFSSEENQQAAKKAFDAASIVFAREQQSFNFVKNYSSNANIIQAPDFTNLLNPLNSLRSDLKGWVAIVPNSKMLSVKNNIPEWQDSYINIILNIINIAVAKGEKVFLLNHEGSEDNKICQQINSLLSKPLEIVEPKSSLEVKAIISHAKAIFCSRYHGCVSALSNGVPCIGTSWSHKYEQLFSEYGVEHLLLPADANENSITLLVNSILDHGQETKDILLPHSVNYKQKSNDMWQSIYKKIVSDGK